LPRTKEAYQSIRDERQEQILSAALSIFVQKGFSATRLTDIASAAGVSYGLVSYYFGNKEELYIAVISRGYQCGLDIFESALQMPGSPWERLMFICQEILSRIRYLPEAPDYLCLINQVETDQFISEKIRSKSRNYEKRSLEILVELIRQGQAAGQVVPGDPVELAIIYNAALRGLFSQWKDPHVRQELEEHFPHPETVLRSLKA